MAHPVVSNGNPGPALVEALDQKSAYIKLLKEMNTATNEANSVREVLEFTIDAICKYTGWKIGHVFIVNPHNENQLISAKIWRTENPEDFTDFREKTEEISISPMEGLPGIVWEQKKPIWVKDVRATPGFIRLQAAKKNNIKMGLAVPVMAGTRVAAVLEFYTDEAIPADEDLLDVMAHIGTLLGRVVEKREAREALEASESRFRSIFENATLGIILLDMKGELIAWNQAFTKMVGYESSELHRAVNEIYTGLEKDTKKTRNFENLTEGQLVSYQYEQRIPQKNSLEIWCSLNVSLMRDKDNQPKSILLILEDITLRKIMESELSELQRRRIENRELERKRLAKELHDGPLQDLYGVNYQLQLFSEHLKDRKKQQSLGEIQKNLNSIVRKLKGICGELRPPTLVPFGLEKAIRSHAENQQEDHPEIKIDLVLDRDHQVLSEALRLALFRIYQQAFYNILKHSFAKQIQVTFQIDAEYAVLEVKDDGIGFDTSRSWIELAREGRLGLVGVAERVEALGGSLQVKSKPGEGTVIRVELPVSNTIDEKVY